MLKEHEELIEKTIETATFINGGDLNAKQQDRFVTMVRKYSTLLPQSRFHRMTQPQEEIDKLHVGEPVTESAEENTNSANQARAKFNKIALNSKKTRSQWHITTESLQANLEQDQLEETLMNAFTERMATDFELLAIQGDSTLTGTDPTSRLLKRLDGWYIQAQSGHYLDAAGTSINKKLLALAKRKMPKQFRNDPGLRWIMSDTLVGDWEDALSDRETALGDRALGGGAAGRPLGIPILSVPLIPDDLLLTGQADASPARLEGSLEQGPFVFGSTNKTIKIDVDNAGAVVTTFPEATLEAVVVANLINAALVAANGAAYANVASTDGFGHIVLTAPTTGAGSEVEIQTDGVNNLGSITLGFWDGTGTPFPITVVGKAAASGEFAEGSFIILANPKNLVFGMLDGTRIFSEFEKDYDRIETVVFNQIDVKIENVDALVLIDNIRLRDLT